VRVLSRILLVVTIFFLSACALLDGWSSGPRLSGRTMFDGQPAAGVQVAAYPATTPSLGGTAPYLSAASDAAGTFSLNLPAGRYYLLARGDREFAYYGRNPVTLGEEGLTDLNIGLVRRGDIKPDLEPMVISGAQLRVSLNGAPLQGATLYAYLDLTSELKGMGYAMVGPSDDEGIAELALPAGTYYLLARKRADGSGVGPLRAGDFTGYYPGNPVQVHDGEVLHLDIPMLQVPQKIENLQESLFGQTSLGGVIRDAGGKPVSGARAVVYRDSQMLNRPDYVSNPTGANGRFLISLPQGGHYYLAGRNTLGGAPGPGDLYGTYNRSDDHSLEVITGQHLEGLEIIVEEMW